MAAEKQPIWKRELGYVYFIQAEMIGLIKIGFSSYHPDRRILAHRVTSPVALIKLGFIRGFRHDEHRAHVQFAKYRDHGEWFAPGAELLDYIRDHVQPWTPDPNPGLRPKKDRERQREVPLTAFTPDEIARFLEVSCLDRTR